MASGIRLAVPAAKAAHRAPHCNVWRDEPSVSVGGPAGCHDITMWADGCTN